MTGPLGTALTSVVDRVVVRLADLSPSPGATPRYEDDAVVRPGWLGLAVFVALLVAAYLLFRSMRTQLKKVDFEEPPEESGPPAPPPPR